ncbi:MAG TPA: protein kinase [Gemmatimonadales bacterium]
MPVDILTQLTRALADRYTVERELGHGGMSTVFLAQDRKHGRAVAIKVLRPDLAQVLGTDRFLQEIQIAARLVHPHILPLHDSGEADGLVYYVMPFVPGESLRDSLDREKQLPIEEAFKITRQVLSALTHAHSHGVIHRDIKPDNVLLSGGEAVVADFGIARAIGVAGDERLTISGMSFGTPTYMSPEQAAGSLDVDARADLYSVACMLHEMLAGQPPFTGSLETVIEQHLTAEPPDVAALRRTVPPAAAAAVRKGLAKAPADRFATAAQFADALGGPLVVTAGSRTRRGGRAAAAVGAGLALVAVAAGAWMLYPAGNVPFENRDWVVVAAFENLTGDTVFDRALDAALSTSISQSRHVNVFPVSRVRETLQRMQRGDVSAVDRTLATEVAAREGVAIVLAPSISQVGETFSISARIVDARTDADLGAASERADGRDDVLLAIDRLGRSLRRQLGETRYELVRAGGWMPRATTSSLEALRAFTDAAQAWGRGQYDVARELWQEALRRDSSFAWAHASMGMMYYWFNDAPAAEEHFGKALEGLNRLTERERLWIRSLIAGSRGDREGAITSLEIYLRAFPDDRDGWFNLGSEFMRLGRCEEAVPALEHALQIDSTLTNAYIQMATCYNSTNRPADAIALYQRAFARDSEAVVGGFINHEYGSALVRAGRLDEAEANFRLMLDREPWQRARGRRSLALLAMYRGQYDSASRLLRDAITIDVSTRQGLTELRDRLFLAAAARTLNDTIMVTRQLAEVERLRDGGGFFIGAYYLLLVGKLYARAGDVGPAERIATAIDAAMGDNDGDRAARDLLLGEIALARGETEDAVRLMELAHARRDDSYFRESLARAYRTAGETDRALETYRAMTEHPTFGTEGQEPAILAYYALGQLYESRGDFVEAVRSYERFVEQWRDADPRVSAAVDAVRVRIATLRRTHGIG